jgi:hypothetical protein
MDVFLVKALASGTAKVKESPGYAAGYALVSRCVCRPYHPARRGWSKVHIADGTKHPWDNLVWRYAVVGLPFCCNTIVNLPFTIK